MGQVLWGPISPVQVIKTLEEIERIDQCGEVHYGEHEIEEIEVVSDCEAQKLELFDERPLAATKSQRKLDGGVSLEKRRQGRPRKIKDLRGTESPKKQRGRPRKSASVSEGIKFSQVADTQLDLCSGDWQGEVGVQTRARRAYIRSLQAGLLFDCPEEVAIQGIARQFRGSS